MLAEEQHIKTFKSGLKQIDDRVLEQIAEAKYHNLVEQLPAITYISALDESSSTLYISPQVKEMLGFGAEEWVKDPDLWVKQLHPEDRERVLAEVARSHARGEPFHSEYRLLASDNHTVWVNDKADFVYDAEGNALVLQGLMLDISEHKDLEDALHKTEERFRQVMDDMFEGCMLIGFDWKYLYLNEVAACHGHRRREDLLGHTMPEMYPGLEQTDIFAHYRQCMTERTPQRFESSFTFADGSTNWFEFRIQPATEGIFVLSTDITERKQAEDVQRHLTRELRAIKSCNETLLRAVDEQTLLNEICRIICEEAGYRLAWVGYAEYDAAKSVRPIAWAGFESGYIKEINPSWADDSDRGRGPTGTAIRNGEVVYVQDFISDPRTFPWRENALQRGYRSSIAFPLKDENANTFGALCMYSVEPNAFTPDEIKLIEQLANDLAFGITTLRNKAEQKMAKDALQESEVMYRSLVNAMAEGAVFQAADGRITAVNPAAQRIMGRTTEQILARTSDDPQWESIHEDGTPFPGEQHPAMITLHTGIPQKDVVMGMHRPDGSLIWISINSQPLILDKEAKPYAVVTTFHDITDRKYAEEALRSSEERFSKIFRLSPVAMVIMRADNGIIVDVNNSFVKDTGYACDEIIGHTILELNLYSDPGEHESILQELQKKGALDNYEFKTRDKSGRVGIALNTTIKINLGGEKHYLSLIQDITERKQTEDKLRKLSRALEQSPVCIMITDTYGEIEYVNPKFTEVTGYALAEVLGKKPSILKSGKMSPDVYNQLWQTITSGKEWYGEFYNKRKNGELYWEMASISPVFDASGNITHYLGVKEDITERKRAEKELIEAKEKAEESDRLKSSFLSNMSHEIRTPMNAIIGFSQFLLDAQFSAERKQYFSEIIRDRSYDLLRIVEDILDVSKIEVGQMKIMEEDADLNRVMEDVHEYYRMKLAKLENDALVLTLSVEDTLKHVTIKTDSPRLKQILNNLLDNALKFTKKGSIEFGCKKQSDAEILFFVKDTGIGVPVDKQEIIFDRFRQAEDLLTERQYGGTGLGLSIVKGLVHLMNGKIWLESEVNAGSTFYVTLPLKISEKKDAVLSENDRMLPWQWENKTALIVEDDEANALFLKEALAKTGMHMLNAFTGKEALQLLQDNSDISLVMMDIRLPDINGLDLSMIIRKNSPGTIIIAQTAYASQTDIQDCLDAGCDDYIAKPINLQDLITIIDHAFSGRRAQRDA